MMTSGTQLWMIVGVYIPSMTHKDIYEATLEGIYMAAAVAQGKGAQLVILGSTWPNKSMDGLVTQDL